MTQWIRNIGKDRNKRDLKIQSLYNRLLTGAVTNILT